MAVKIRPGNELAGAGFGELHLVPFLIGDDGAYCISQNRFLRERATNRWMPGDRETTVSGAVRRLTTRTRLRPLTLDAYADALTNFTTWLEDAGSHSAGSLTVDTVTERDLERYAIQMESGQWASDGKPLAPATMSLRLSTVIDFLEFAARHKLRPPINFTMSEYAYRSKSGGRNATDGSRGSKLGYQVLRGRRAKPGHLTLPTLRQLAEFVGLFSDETHRLGAEFILNCGLRIAEVGAIRERTILSVSQALKKWGHLEVDIDFPLIGKGQKLRTPSFPGDMLSDIDAYRTGERRKRLTSVSDLTARSRNGECLLIQSNGQALSVAALRKAWNQARLGMEKRGHKFEGFTPHLGRHAFAVYWLLARVGEDAERISQLPKNLPAGAIRAFGESHLITLQRKLGHASLSTTEKYLVLLPDLARYGQTVIARQDFLDNENS